MKIATVCTGIGSPEKAIENLGIPHEIVFGCEIDKYARETYLANFNPGFMVQDMTKESWEGEQFYSDLFIGGIPCQAFSLAGKRLGELDPRGLLFFDFYRYVKNQKPKYFIIENVKGLLSDNDGNTFQNWINLLGQSVNGDQFMFPHEDSLMYNLHWQVLNTKDYGLPQNRERVFLIGIRNDLPNSFVFPKGVPLKLRLKDILEDEVDEKYYLSEKMVNYLQVNNKSNGGRSLDFTNADEKEISNCLQAVYYKTPTDGEYLKVPSATKSGYEVAQTLTTSCNQGVMVVGFERTEEAKKKRSENMKKNGVDTGNFSDRQLILKDQDYSDTILANPNHQKEGLIAEFKIGAMRGRNPKNPSDRTTGAPTQQMLEINENGTSNCLTSVQKDNLVVYTGIAVHPLSKKLEFDGFKDGNSPALLATDYKAPKCVQYSDYRIRKLTPKECFRLQGFPDEFLQNAIDAGVSNSQLYKQAGNSISVPVIQAILKNLLTV